MITKIILGPKALLGGNRYNKPPSENFLFFLNQRTSEITHTHGLRVTAKISPIEIQNPQTVTIRSVDFCPVDGRTNPISGSMIILYVDTRCTYSMKI